MLESQSWWVHFILHAKISLFANFYENQTKSLAVILYLQNIQFWAPCSTPIRVLRSEFWWFHIIWHVKVSSCANFYVNRMKTVRDILYLQNTRFLVPYSAPVIGLISQFWWFHVVLYAKMSFLANFYENRIKNGEDINVCPNTPFWARISHILVFFFKTFDGPGELKFWPALMIKVILSPS